MGYKVDYDSLNSMYNSIGGRANTWVEELEILKSKFQTLVDSSNMSGAAATNLKSYVENVHFTLIGLLSQLISLHSLNCLLYKDDYQANVDTELHAVLDETEISDYISRLRSNNSDMVDVDGAVKYILDGVKNYFYVYYNDISDVDATHKSTITFLNDLNEEIKTLEQNHNTNDFVSSAEMIRTLKNFIIEQKTFSRDYKSGFSPEQLGTSNAFAELYAAHLAISSEMEAKAEAIETAIDNENQRVTALQEEYEERQKKATIINWVVTGVCVVGSIAAIVATGGAATPLVVGGISAVSGAVIAGTNNLTSQYVEHGNLIENSEDIDWGSFGKDVVIAGASGFITGYVGASVGGAITNSLKNTATGSALLNSTNSMVRIGTGAAIGSVSEVTSGVVSRGTATLVTSGFDVKQSLDAAFSGKDMALDCFLGGTNGAVEQVTSIGKAQTAADEATLKYNEKYNPLETGKENGLENLKATKNGGVDFSESDYIMRTETGEPIEVKIKSTGNRKQDYALAEKILKEEYGIDIDFRSMRTGKNKTHVWHHMDDYNVMTNETTMQFIDIDAHKAIGNHTGSAKQYHVAHGTGYSKQEMVRNYNGFSFLDYTSVSIGSVSETFENVAEINQSEFAFGQ